MDKKTLKKKAWHLHDIALVVLLVFSIYSLTQFFRHDDPMIVEKVYIPDHAEGQDPEVIYSRTVLEDFIARWDVFIYDITDQIVVCTGGDTTDYKTTSDVSGVTLSWYVGKHCDLPPGKYMARTTWKPLDDEIITNASNVFQVFPEGSRRAREALRQSSES